VPVVVSDTSPIRALALLERIPLLNALFADVRVPPAVVQELAQPRIGPVVRAEQLVGIAIQAPQDRGRVADLRRRVDAGEAEAIALALEVRAERILIDDKAGRGVAAELHLPFSGTLALLVLAKHSGLVDAVRPMIDRLRAELNFYMDDGLEHTILRQAGEDSSSD